jgi:hypothetical protein
LKVEGRFCLRKSWKAEGKNFGPVAGGGVPFSHQPSTLFLVPMRRMGTQCEMRRIYTALCPVESANQFALNWMQRIQDEFPCGAWEPETTQIVIPNSQVKQGKRQCA